ncbi:photosystem I subunit O [Canna indica]|uniref:Photosystem I subunit O n=1 Tax=Canna indica TaxID=4628 RepID=A0AAQ3KP67_9LILI|nr:photosystem I subunit O [Canna indica]
MRSDPHERKTLLLSRTTRPPPFHIQKYPVDFLRDLQHQPRLTTPSAMAAAISSVAGLRSSLPVSPSSSKPSLTSGFIKSQVVPRNPLKLEAAAGGRFICFERNWLRKDLNVIGFGLIGWLAPSSIPAIGGKSLTGLFFDSIGTELAHWPTGPALTSPFWLWMVTWHLGLFLCLTFGQIGFKGRTEDYFP